MTVDGADLDGILVSKKVDDFEGMCDNADCHELLAVVAALHHQTINQSLNNGHLCFLELLLGITSGSVRQVDSMADLDVIG